MKTIQLPDEMYERLIKIAQEIDSQDNRATAKPYLFQVRQDEKVWDSGTNRRHQVFVDFTDDPYDFEATPEGVRSMCESFDLAEPDNLDEMSDFEIHEWVTSHPELNVEECSYDIEHNLSNAFFTEKGIKEYIKQNGYNYNNPVDYLSYASRNPEMKLVFELFETLLKQE